MTALIEGAKAGDKVTLKLPDGMKFKKGSSAEQSVPKTKQNQVPITWHIEANRTGTFDIEVSTNTGKGLTQKKRIVIRPAAVI